MGQFSPWLSSFTLFPKLVQRTRSAWEHLARPVTLPEDVAQWQSLLSGMGPVPGPFDWSLCFGPLRAGRRARVTGLGHVVEAWRGHDYPDAKEALARLAREVVRRAHEEYAVDLWSELPVGFDSGTPLTVASLVTEPASSELWNLRWASSCENLPAQSNVWDHALQLTVPVQGRRVLLTTPVFDRPEVASGCVHLLRAQGAAWVGLIALATDVGFG